MSNEIISQVFGNSTTLAGSLAVEKMISLGFAVCGEFAEPIISSWIESGLVKPDGKNLTLVPQGPSPQEIKANWFKLRQLEKTNPTPAIMKIQAEAFERWCGWSYFIFNSDLRKAAQKLGYTPKPEQRKAFNKLLQS